MERENGKHSGTEIVNCNGSVKHLGTIKKRKKYCIHSVGDVCL